MATAAGPLDVVFTRPDLSSVPPDPFDIALDRLGKIHHDSIFNAAWEKWWAAYYDMIYEAAFDVVWETETGDEAAFDKAMDVQMDKEISAEMDETFGRFFDYEFRKQITREMIDAEIKKIEAGQ